MRAEVTRLLAEDVRDPKAKTVMLRIAHDFDLLVRLAEERLDQKH